MNANLIEDKMDKDKLIKLINHYSSSRYDGATDKRIYHDIKIWGDDASEFMNKYSVMFNVDLNQFHMKDYFPNEGGFLLAKLPSSSNSIHSPYKELTVQNLLIGIKNGYLL